MNLYNILYITESYSTHDKRFLNAAIKSGVNIWFTCIKSIDSFYELPKGVKTWPGIDKPFDEWNHLIKKYNIHAIHAGPCSNVLPLIVSKSFNCALIGMSWGRDILVDIDDDKDLHNSVLNALEKIDTMIVDCNAVIEKISKLLPDKFIQYFKFPWGINLDNFKRLPRKQSRRLREKLNWTDHTVFISTRSWDTIYCIDNLIDAFELLVKKDPDVRLILIGDGPLRKKILNKIKLKKLEKYIHIPGRILEEDLNVWYGSADIYISSSICDGSSVSLLEAMACGLPVVVNNRHGNKEWVKNNENGWLTNCENINDLFIVMEEVVQYREKWKEMGQQNRSQVINYADWRNNSNIIVDAYKYAYNKYSKLIEEAK